MLKVLTRPEAARLLRVSIRTLDFLVASRQVPFKRLGRSIRFSEKALEDFMNERNDEAE